MPLSKLVKSANPRNPRRHALKTIETSIADLGYIDAIVYNRATGRILHGHGRIEALKRMHARNEPPPDGIVADGNRWEVPVLVVDVPEARETMALYALNRSSELGEWDAQALDALLRELANADTDWHYLLDSLQCDLDALLSTQDAPPPALPEPAEVKPILGKSYDDKLADYEASDTRQVILTYPPKTYERVIACLQLARARYGVDTNAEAVLALLEDQFGAEVETNDGYPDA